MRIVSHYPFVSFYRRRLPHLHYVDQSIFITWRLHDSLPPGRWFPGGGVSSGYAFAVMDRLLDETRTGPHYLAQEPIAGMVVEAIHYNADVLQRYALQAFVVMPNHVHMLVIPRVPLPEITKTLKSFTARQANRTLGLAGPFWQDESYDRLVRNAEEYTRIERYIEYNPVRAGLAREPGDYRWSSAWATGRSPADEDVRPTRLYAGR